MYRDTAVHFGVTRWDGEPVDPNLLTPGVIARFGERNSPHELVYVHDGDSFTVWGEAATLDEEEGHHWGHPLHVVLNLPRGWSRQTAIDTVPFLRMFLVPALPDDARLCDYVVVTDRAEWSRNAEIVGCFA